MFFGFDMGGNNRTELYSVLGLTPDASEDQVKKQYRKLALKHHPDRGGNPEEFRKIQEAYDAILNPTGETSDNHPNVQGNASYNNSGQHHTHHHDIFRHFFGSSVPPQHHQPQPRRAPDVTHVIKMNLEDVFAGRVFRMKVNRSVPCTVCADTKTVCPGCKGVGVQSFIRRHGNVMEQFQQPCPPCKGSGSVHSNKNCEACEGTRKTTEEEILLIDVPPGTGNGTRFECAHKGDVPANGGLAGHIYFIVEHLPHRYFSIVGEDLAIQKTLSITEALCGYEFTVTHLNGTKYVLRSDQATPVGTKKRVKSLGMHPLSDLIIEFSIEIPKSMERVDELRLLLPSVPKLVLEGDEEEIKL